MRKKFIIEVETTDECYVNDIKEYIEESVNSWCGQFHSNDPLRYVKVHSVKSYYSRKKNNQSGFNEHEQKLIKDGRSITALKCYRDRTGVNLKMAKLELDKYRNQQDLDFIKMKEEEIE